MALIRKMSPEYADYLFDESRTMGHAEYIAFPTCEKELAEAVRWCAAHRIPLTAQGALTGLAGGASPAGGLILKRGNIETNCTVELLIDLCKAELSADVAKVLFS